MSETVELYDEKFFADIKEGSKLSAKEIVPIILQLVSCKSVIDVGCGTGAWLSVFLENGVQEVQGLDGAYVNQEMLQIPLENFEAADLTKPLKIERNFDLAMSVEVAEHLPEESSKSFIDSLTKLAPVVLFSASIPYQDGIGHINEQWNDYWIKLFQAENFVAIDFIRPRVWQNQDVAWWYKQNILIFVDKSKLHKYPLLSSAYDEKSLPPSLVHPEIFIHQVNKNIQMQGLLDRKIVKAGIFLDSLYHRFAGLFR